jgi:hypothetical protein
VRGLIAVAGLALLSAACSDVSIKPQARLPKPLIVQLPATVGLIIPAETRRYVEQETRFGIDWRIDLGPGEVRLLQEVFRDLFAQVEEFKDLAAAGSREDLKALFEARVDQYSFVTARETGGRYCAVTIRYRINMYTPRGEKVDSYTLMGYGNALALGMSGGKPLAQATAGAMRDAAAKLLVQLPMQTAAKPLAVNEAVVPDKQVLSSEAAEIEAVPIDEPEGAEGGPAVGSPPLPATPASPVLPSQSPPSPALSSQSPRIS